MNTLQQLAPLTPAEIDEIFGMLGKDAPARTPQPMCIAAATAVARTISLMFVGFRYVVRVSGGYAVVKDAGAMPIVSCHGYTTREALEYGKACRAI